MKFIKMAFDVIAVVIAATAMITSLGTCFSQLHIKRLQTICCNLSFQDSASDPQVSSLNSGEIELECCTENEDASRQSNTIRMTPNRNDRRVSITFTNNTKPIHVDEVKTMN